MQNREEVSSFLSSLGCDEPNYVAIVGECDFYSMKWETLTIIITLYVKKIIYNIISNSISYSGV